MQEILIQPATVEPVPLSLAKEFLRVTHKLEDQVIGQMISSARKMCEDAVQISICPQKWKVQYRLPQYRCEPLGVYRSLRDPERISTKAILPRPPLVSVDAINFVDLSGNRTPMLPYQYNVNLPLNLVNWSFPDTFNLINFGFPWDPINKPVTLEIDISTGYPLWQTVNPPPYKPWNPAVAIPQDLTQAILLVTSSLYENRGDENTSLPKKALLLMRPYYVSTRSSG